MTHLSIKNSKQSRWYDGTNDGLTEMFFIGRMPCVSSLIADKYLLCLHNYFMKLFPSLEKKNTQSLVSFPLIFIDCPKPTQRLKLRRMGWFGSLEDRHWCATLIQLGRYFKSYRKWLVQWVFLSMFWHVVTLLLCPRVVDSSSSDTDDIICQGLLLLLLL